MKRLGRTDITELSTCIAAYPEERIRCHLSVEKNVIVGKDTLLMRMRECSNNVVGIEGKRWIIGNKIDTSM